jgi:hypothetical protein
MAKVELNWREVRDDTFPQLCLRCGAPASERVHKTYYWIPWWKSPLAVLVGVLLVPVGIIPILGKFVYRSVLAGLATPEEMLVRSPLCSAHRHHWRWRQYASWGGIIALAVGVALAEVLFFSPKSPFLGTHWFPGHVSFYVWVGWGFLLWLASVIVIHLTAIRAARITETSIILRGVAAAFADQHNRERTASPKGPGKKKQPAPLPEGIAHTDSIQYQVVGALAGDSSQRVVATFEDRKKAQDYAQFLRETGKYQRVEVQEQPSG